jgi:uncharacterized membrane protein
MAQAVPTDPVSAIATAVGQVASASTFLGARKRKKEEIEGAKSLQRQELKNKIIAERLGGSKDKTMTYVLIGVGVVALVGVAIYFSRKK